MVKRVNIFYISDRQDLFRIKTQNQGDKKISTIKASKILKMDMNLNKPNALSNRFDKIEKRSQFLRNSFPSKKSETSKEIKTPTETEGSENIQPSKAETMKTTNIHIIYCEICDENFKNDLEFAVHSVKHNHGKYVCYICEYKASSADAIKRHVRSHKYKPTYKCKICNEGFGDRTYALEHKNFHTGEKPFQCEFCGKDFMFSRHFNWHRRTNHFIKFSCEICNKQYMSSKGLKLHKKRHHMGPIDESRICETCGKRIATLDNLKLHMRIHSGYKPHACTVCPKRFTRKQHLTDHLRVHTGERPYKCDQCDKTFPQRTSLQIHKRIHTGEKPYTCRLCNRAFISKNYVNVHLRRCGRS